MNYNLIIAMCLQAGFSPNIVQEATSEQAVIGLVAAGVGGSLVSACLTGLRTDDVIYRPLIDPAASVEYVVVWKRENPSPFVKAFLNVVRDVSEYASLDSKKWQTLDLFLFSLRP